MDVQHLDPAARNRALELLGITRYVVRGTDTATTQVSAVPAAEPAPARVAGGRSTRVRFAVDVAEGGAAPLRGRYGKLIAQLMLALDVGNEAIAFDSNIDAQDAPVVCFGTAPGDARDALLAPPLSSLRLSATAKRALWPQWRKLRRQLLRSN